jgi:hypothetical protein
MAGKRYPYEVKYEKIGQLCFACGLLGHSYKECGDGVFDEATLKFGDFVYVTPLGRGRGSSSFRGGLRGERVGVSFGGGRDDKNLSSGRGRGAEGRGRGGVPYYDWRKHPERHANGSNKDLSDTTTSPTKVNDQSMTEADLNAKRRLGFDGAPTPNPTLTILGPNMLIDGENSVDLDPIDNPPAKENKRTKLVDGTSVSGASSGSAASLEGDRRAQ